MTFSRNIIDHTGFKAGNLIIGWGRAEDFLYLQVFSSSSVPLTSFHPGSLKIDRSSPSVQLVERGASLVIPIPVPILDGQ